MGSVSASGGTASNRRLLAIVLAVIGVLAIVAGILYLAGGGALPTFMLNKVHGKAVTTGHHQARAAVTLVVGVALLVGAWFTGRVKSR